MIAVVDYRAGNIGSVVNALKRLNAEFEVTSDSIKIKKADGVIFPGQGRAGPAMKSLQKTGLDNVLPTLTQPFLGICLGMQLMVEWLEEDDQPGLGIIPGECKRFQSIKPVPHMGWNQVKICRKSPLFDGIEGDFYQYFVHSYAVKAPNKFVLATTEYGSEFASVIGKNNFYGVQFHPEKSVENGAKLLQNFLRICGEIK